MGVPNRSTGFRLSIRARLTLWYSVVVFVILTGAGVAVLALHGGLGLARVDEELKAAHTTLVGVIENEMDEGLGLEGGVRDALGELNLPDVGMAVLNARLGLVQAKPAGAGVVPDSMMAAASPVPTSMPASSPRWRLRADTAFHGGQTFRVVVWVSLSGLQRERATLERSLLLGIPLAMLLAAFGGWSLGRRALQPLADVAAQAEGIGRNQRQARLTVPNPGDELGTLARAFNGLLDRLGAALEAQRAFMADASHQLRTPVSVARTAAQVTLARGERPEAEYREALEIIAGQTERLTKMVDDMFMLALADAEARPLQVSPLYLDDLVTTVAAEARVLADERHITLRTESSGETPFLGDEHLLRQMLMNMVDNAVRHTPAGGRVVISLEGRPDFVSLAVTDSGTGVAPGHEADIFHRFVRFDEPGAQGGAGLGLPIARWVAECHSGTLVLESTGPHGSRFVATLPTSPGVHSEVGAAIDEPIH